MATMRKYVLPVIASTLLAGCGGRTQPAEDDDPRVAIERSIKAQGGEDRLARITAVRSKGRGAVVVDGEAVPMTLETVFQMPDKLRMVQQIKMQGRAAVVTQVLAGKRGWVSIDGEVQELEGGVLRSLQEECYAVRVETLVPLLREEGHSLSMLSDVEVGGRRVVGVRVSARGRGNIDLYFDRDSYLPVRTVRPMLGVDTQREVPSEVEYGDFRDDDGLKWPSRTAVHQRGRKVMEVVLTEFKRLDKVDPAEFSRPR
jgi:uncharacterized protein YcfL